ncbi:unnamed protein product [Citrullus colocynthis]|uniref:Glutathione S-transferase n=1 Tax=Citrullus colocynthis TaxID=252529 RepID=A0ABP0YLJ3_9ROSI
MAEELQVFGFWSKRFAAIYKKVPALVHHGKPISESLVILEYIDETWRENYPILPQHPHQRALARVWAKSIDDKVVPAIVKAVGSKGEEMEKAVEEVKGALEPLEKELKIGNKLLGRRKNWVCGHCRHRRSLLVACH